ncbi:MAG: hypothetical protein IPL42_17395 [Saprospiraceae bacterium]|nr:hypothetical protein [Saprospiraceae bacterium]
MDYLGNRNLFTSEFIIGCELPINEEFEFVKALNHWLKFKDNDREMRNFRSERTQYIAFLHIIELKVFKEILNDLVKIYKKSYPFGEKRDFIKHTFYNTLYALENIIDWNFTYYFSPPPGIGYDICYYFEDKFKYPIIDFLLEPPKDIDYYKQYYKKIVELINNLDFDGINSVITPQPTNPETEKETIESKPVFISEAVQTVFEIIKDFFSYEQQAELKQLLETGTVPSKKLLFMGNSNRLTDTFKKLIEHDIITCCQKQDLIKWVISNFTFIYRNQVKAFKYDTVEKTISRNDNPCKSPLIVIKHGQIQKVEEPRTKIIVNSRNFMRLQYLN